MDIQGRATLSSLRAACLWLGALGCALLLTFTELKVFSPWDQVVSLWENDVSPVLIVGHPHFFRYLAAYPGFLAEELWPDVGFSAFVALFFATNIVLFEKLCGRMRFRTPSFISWTLFICVHLFMNGRGVIAWTAWLLCLNVCVARAVGMEKEGAAAFKTAMALFLAAASTGVFVVVALSFLIFAFREGRVGIRPRSRLQYVLYAVIGVPVLIFAGGYFWVSIEKNINYFGGGLTGLVNMLQHGAGRVFLESSVALVALILSMPVFLLGGFLMLTGRRWGTEKTLFAVVAAGGLFGFTVLTLALPLVALQLTDRRVFKSVLPRGLSGDESNEKTV